MLKLTVSLSGLLSSALPRSSWMPMRRAPPAYMNRGHHHDEHRGCPGELELIICIQGNKITLALLTIFYLGSIR
jgi:hypothetical protein